jgi:hypothetical protein
LESYECSYRKNAFIPVKRFQRFFAVIIEGEITRDVDWAGDFAEALFL